MYEILYTENQVSPVDWYTILRVEDLFLKLSGGKSFTMFEMSHTYHQLNINPPNNSP